MAWRLSNSYRRTTRTPSRKASYVQFQGKQHRLAVGEICDKCQHGEKDGTAPRCKECAKVRYAADLRFAELVHLAEVETVEDNGLIFALTNRYLKWCKPGGCRGRPGRDREPT